MKSNRLLTLLIFTSLIFVSQQLLAQQLTQISTIQGSGKASQFINKEVTVEGIVTADFQDEKSFSGYYIQDQSSKVNSGVSNGIFIYDNTNSVSVGDLIMISGVVSEHNGLTQLSKIAHVKILKSNQKLPKPIKISLPLKDLDLESLESMRVTLKKPAFITDHYNEIKYGEIVVSSKISMNPTNNVKPGKQVHKKRKQNANDRLLIDDGSFKQFNNYQNKNNNSPVHIGAKVQVVGIMHYAFDKYRVEISEPIKFLETPYPKLSKPTEIDGQVKIASFNIRNYFTTLDNGKEICGPLQDFGCRGADSKEEFIHQQAKIVNAIKIAQADIYAIQELENHKDTLRILVKALNKNSKNNPWNYIETGVLGEDVIRVGLIYKNKAITPIGKHKLLNATVMPKFEGDKNREVLLQTFKDSDNNLFNVAVVHLKSKRCDDSVGLDTNQNDGQGCYNATRTRVAQQISDWLAKDPTGKKAQSTIIAGDFNSYTKEDPITTFEKNGFVNLARAFLTPENWTSIFRGEAGSIDHIIANKAARKSAKGMTQWHINSIVSGWFDYNLEDLAKGKPKPKNYYNTSPFSSSDHDMIIAGFDF